LDGVEIVGMMIVGGKAIVGGLMMDALGLISMGAVGLMGDANRWRGRAAC